MSLQSVGVGRQKYGFLPFRFQRSAADTVLLTNEVGEYLFLSTRAFEDLCNGRLSLHSEMYHDLLSKQFIAIEGEDWAIDLLATKYRTRKRFLEDYTALHMVVPTLCCNARCVYCQVSSRSPGEPGRSMSRATADKIVETIFRSRSRAIKIEFQGGEPLLRFDLVRYIVECAERRNRGGEKDLEFVVCTNLTILDSEQLAFFKDHEISVSTSLDGPKDIHDANRPLRNGDGTYERVVRNLETLQRELGEERVSALMTITTASIDRLRDVIDEYRRRGLASIFLRALNPYGRATKDALARSYGVKKFVAAYKDALAYVLSLNRAGVVFVEEYAALMLRRILTPFETGFVDLQSPSGCAISAALYNYDGSIYASDEGRMLAETGDQRFRMGNVHNDTYESMFFGPLVEELIRSSVIETLPGCHTCVYCAYCGTDPVRNFVEQGDLVGNCYLSDACEKDRGILDYIFSLLREEDDDTLDILWSWATHRRLQKVSDEGYE